MNFDTQALVDALFEAEGRANLLHLALVTYDQKVRRLLGEDVRQRVFAALPSSVQAWLVAPRHGLDLIAAFEEMLAMARAPEADPVTRLAAFDRLVRAVQASLLPDGLPDVD